MGWQIRSYGSRYDSSSGNALIIGGISKGIIGMVLYSKSCRNFYATYKREEQSEEHEWPKIFEGSSKNMEAAAIMKMVEYTFLNRSIIIDVIVSED